MPIVRAHVIIHGYVQGVFFRDSARREARARGLAGWTRNRPDGTVEAVFQGEEDGVAALVQWSHTGPPQARVSRVEIDWQEPIPDEPAFRVR